MRIKTLFYKDKDYKFTFIKKGYNVLFIFL